MFKYLQYLEKFKIIPNFFCSEEYFKKSGIMETEEEGILFILEGEMSTWIIVPPIDTLTEKLADIESSEQLSIWSDFPDYKPEGFIPQLLDQEFIFNPKSFLNMAGGEWQTFRKNCRKFPNRFSNGTLSYIKISNLIQKRGEDWVERRLRGVLLSWLESINPETLIQDEDLMIKYLLKGQNRKVLVNPKGDIYGINIWDSNYHYINYRFCFCKKDDFLSEYMRFLFYTDPEIQKQNKLVNDGGSVGNPNLLKFKMKMNPVQVRNVYSWIRKDEPSMR